MSASFYDLLKYAKTGIASPEMTAYDKMRAVAMAGGGAIKTLTGVPPLSFKADGKPLISWSMLGNGRQNGTPTPDNPIMPTFLGVRTANLFDEIYPDISVGALVRYKPIYVGDGTFTLSTTTPYDKSVANLFLLSGKVSGGASSSGNGAWYRHNVTTQASNGFITIGYRQYTGTTSPAGCKTMLNPGSTALPYEPYGWKIPVTNAGQTVPIYLGEVPTVRRIRKLVLTGEEMGWSTVSGNAPYYIALPDIVQTSDRNIVLFMATHYLAVPNNASWSSYTACVSWVFSVDTSTKGLLFRDTSQSTLDDFKTYLARQYANGTPVTIWYVLATPTTSIVNEPLCKIGTYADELSSTDAGVTIPTTKGQNTLTVDTDLQPSKMTITYRG